MQDHAAVDDFERDEGLVGLHPHHRVHLLHHRLAVQEARHLVAILDRPAEQPRAHVEVARLLERDLGRQEGTRRTEGVAQHVEPRFAFDALLLGHGLVDEQARIHSEGVEHHAFHALQCHLPHAALSKLCVLAVEHGACVRHVALRGADEVLQQQGRVNLARELARFPQRLHAVHLVLPTVQRSRLVEARVGVALIAQQVVAVCRAEDAPAALQVLHDFGALLVQQPVHLEGCVVHDDEPHILGDGHPSPASSFLFVPVVQVLNRAVIRLGVARPAV